MRTEIKQLRSRVQTGKAIYKSASKYYRDLGYHLDDSLHSFFSYVKNIPYKEDPTGTEIVSRPKYLLQGTAVFEGMDCKKKAVLIGAWAEAHGVPWRLLAVSERKDKQIHHVFPQLKINGEWKTVDATYPDYQLFMPKKITAGEELLR